MFLLLQINNNIKYVLRKTINIKYIINLQRNYHNKINNNLLNNNNTIKISNLRTITRNQQDGQNETNSTIPSGGSLSSSIHGNGKKINNDEWINIYQLPVIQFIASLNKLKIYQTIFAGTTIPLSYALGQLNYIDIEFFQTFSVLGVSGCITLYLFGLCTKNLIGRIYIKQNDDGADVDDGNNMNLIKLSYINFWGYRKDVELPKNQILLLVNTKKLNMFYRNVHSFEANQSYKLMIPPFGTVLNPELFIENIGEIC